MSLSRNLRRCLLSRRFKAIRKRKRSQRNWRRLNDRGSGLSIEQERVQHAIEDIDAFQMETHDEAILSRDTVALDHTRRVLREFDDLLNLTRQRPNSHHDRHRITQQPRIEIEPDAADQPDFLKTLHTFANGGARHAHGSRELRIGNPWIGGKRLQYLHVDRVGK